MRFYTHQHRYTCGIDLHARSLYVCILDDTGQTLVHKNIKASPEALLKLITDYQDDLIISVECMFPYAYVYPRGLRSIRDLMRRRIKAVYFMLRRENLFDQDRFLASR